MSGNGGILESNQSKDITNSFCQLIPKRLILIKIQTHFYERVFVYNIKQIHQNERKRNDQPVKKTQIGRNVWSVCTYSNSISLFYLR